MIIFPDFSLLLFDCKTFMNKPTNLFAEFAKTQKADWQAEVLKELKGTPFDTLIGRSFDDFEIEPLYTKTDKESLAYLQHYQPISENSQTGYAARIWRNAPVFGIQNEKESNPKILEALQNGAEEIVLDITQANNIQWAELLKEVGLEYCAVSIFAKAEQITEIKNYLIFAKNAELTGSIAFQDFPSDSLLLDLFQISAPFPKLKTVVVEARNFSKPSDELAFFLKKIQILAENMPKNGISLPLLFSKMQFRTHLQNIFFVEIAKLRALRIVASELMNLYLPDQISAQEIDIHAFTSIPSGEASPKDVHSNMISNTAQGMAGVIGGANVLTVLPHNQGLEPESDWANRIALNVSNLLREETYLDKILDPSAGSYYIEQLTDKIAETAWEKMRKD